VAIIEKKFVMTEYRKFGPKLATHPSVGHICSLCGKPFKAGDYTTLIAIEAGFASAEDAQKAMDGRPYNVRAEEVHYDCAIK
jgi:hypothetical protein